MTRGIIKKMHMHRLKKGRVKQSIASVLLTIAFAGNASASGITDKIIRYMYDAFDALLVFIANLTISMIWHLMLGLKTMILLNPDPATLKPMITELSKVLIPVYVIGLMILAIYIFFISGSIEGRIKAKNMFWKLVLSMVLISLSLDIVKILLDLSNALSLRMMGDIVDVSNPRITALRDMGTLKNMTTLIFLLITFILALFIIAFRYLFTTLMCTILPITLFLYFFDYTKDRGIKYLKYTSIAIFTPVVQAMMLSITITAINSAPPQSGISGAAITIFVLGGCALMIAVAPIIMFGIHAWIGTAIAGAGAILAFKRPALGGLMVGTGSAMAGLGPSAGIAGGTAYFFGKSHIASIQGLKRSKQPVEQRPSRWQNLKDKTNQKTDWAKTKLETQAQRGVFAGRYSSPESLRQKLKDNGVVDSGGKWTAGDKKVILNPKFDSNAGLDDHLQKVKWMDKHAGQNLGKITHLYGDAEQYAHETSKKLKGMTESNADSWIKNNQRELFDKGMVPAGLTDLDSPSAQRQTRQHIKSVGHQIDTGIDDGTIKAADIANGKVYSNQDVGKIMSDYNTEQVLAPDIEAKLPATEKANALDYAKKSVNPDGSLNRYTLENQLTTAGVGNTEIKEIAAKWRDRKFTEPENFEEKNKAVQYANEKLKRKVDRT